MGWLIAYEKKQTRRRSVEERIADLERKRQEVLEKQRAALAKIESGQW
ncbi:hypothetical protein [Acidithiobacillus caldus]|uniref:Uncharacterized protein n=1 Tax=Acidithiobacillus caldus (strain SM-1) TaxID=990288 RepID=F9ZU97_ACICS|nr:hypothetical protein [Acidithiobacillus caldus]AEK59716.1 hypothetical protein Atc_m185 [Acidithiobacillus caldus SM-1]QER43318.1 hypothetical protein F0726_00229 [Acidithiobacillus caldus]